MNNIDVVFNNKVNKKLEIDFKLLQMIILYHSLVPHNNKKFSTVVRELFSEGYSMLEELETIPCIPVLYQEYISQNKYPLTVKIEKVIYESILYKSKTRGFNMYKFSYVIYVAIYIATMTRLKKEFGSYFMKFYEYF
ncbi:MAG: hypothetical protein B6226_05215 [Candidatus Cloacimonetes bacterium 4572_65]|nr:MAG: hypothetical protein B6226_05215 [Candidatus Cloacimonetes bacterium 4572_65]